MDYIKIAVCSEHRLISDGICSLIEQTQGFQITLQESHMEKLLSTPDLFTTNILILHPNILDLSVINLIDRLRDKYSKLQILILSSEQNQEYILKSIKSGARGFLAKDSDKTDLLEAIYTVRAGHDYYSKSITQLLLNQYISGLQTGVETFEHKDISCLSARELEVLKLWGDSCTNSEISEKLFISIRTVESHKNHIMQKLNMKTAVDLVKFAIKNNIIKV